MDKIYDRLINENDRFFWRKGLKSELSKGILRVVFEKKDSTLRTMICTTKLDKIPEENIPEKGKERKYDDNKLCVIYDIENDGWRSFNYDQVISAEVFEVQ